MDLIADILLVAGSFGAAIYCYVLATRLKRFTTLESGMGGAIAVLSAQVDDMTIALEKARGAANGSAESLEALTARGESVARRLELLVASLHDLPDPKAAASPPRPNSPEPGRGATPAVRAPTLTERLDGGRGMNRKAGRGALFIVAMLFATSGALRLGSGVGTALAQAEDRRDGVAAVTPANCEKPAALAEALSLREGRLVVREAALNDRQAALQLADKAITERLAALEAMETQLRETLALADGAAEADVERLTAVYQAMKPKDAAALFETMSPDFAAGFLGRMAPESAAAILSGMSAEAAYGISVIVAGRNASAPTE